MLSTGTSDEDYKRLNEILKEYSFFEFICIDIANGYSDHFSKFVSSVRKKYPTKTIIAGNVVTADMTQELNFSWSRYSKSWHWPRKCLYNTHSNRCRISTIKCCY